MADLVNISLDVHLNEPSTQEIQNWYVNTKLNNIFNEYKRFMVLNEMLLTKNRVHSLSLDFEPLRA